jgi:hypothetical protein
MPCPYQKDVFYAISSKIIIEPNYIIRLIFYYSFIRNKMLPIHYISIYYVLTFSDILLMMKKIVYYLWRGTLLSLGIWSVLCLIISLLPIEFRSTQIEGFFYAFGFFGFPFCVLLSLTQTIGKSGNVAGDLAIIVITIFLAISLFFFIVMNTALAGMCTNITEKVIFTHRKNPNIRIEERRFGCGATDSSPIHVHLSKMERCFFIFDWVNKIDTATIRKEEWLYINR